MALEIEGQECPERFSLASQHAEAEGGKSCAVDAEEDGSLLACAEEGGALGEEEATSER